MRQALAMRVFPHSTCIIKPNPIEMDEVERGVIFATPYFYWEHEFREDNVDSLHSYAKGVSKV